MTDKTGEKTAPVPLHFRFPVAKDEKGGEFTHCEEFLDHLCNSEAGGFWPIGRNGLWHGAIHITHASAPWCALSSPSAEEQESHPEPFTGQQPLRNMADGEVVAYRVCSDLKEARWWGNPVPHACSFVLIRHYVQPGETKQSGLTFYTLYMNLAPWSAYTHDNAHNWTVNWSSGLKSFADNSRAWQTGTLPRGTKISWDNTDPALKREDGGTIMGHVTLRQNVHTPEADLQTGDKVWVSVRDAANLRPEFGGATRPAWWETLLPPHQHTLELDKVVCPDPIPVKAGDAIGHLGYLGHPSDSRFSMQHEGQYQVHIECFTADDNLAHFLTNPEQVDNDKPAWLKFIPGVTAYDYSDWPMKFEPRKEPSTLDAVQRLADEARSAKDGYTGQLYWCSGQKLDWIRDEDTKKLSRYDLAGQGFELVDIPTTGFKYLGENRSRKGLIRKLMEVLHFSSRQEQRTKYGAMKYEYERFLRDIDADREYDRHQILSWLYVPMLRHSLNRLIIKHTSAWAYASHAMWEEEHLSDYRKNEPGEAEYWDTVLNNEVWIPDLDKSKVNLPGELWHMHPIMFLDAIKNEEYDFSTREGTIKAIITESKKQGFMLNTQIAYILATVKRETGDTFKPVREGDWVGHTSTDEYRRTHYRYYPYYGRGYVQITWDYNYRKYSDKLGVDLITNPDKALEPNNSLYILIDGFKFGVFTGKKLTDYVSDTKTDFYHARQCINGLDHAEQIKGFADDFLNRLDAGEWQ